MKGGGSKNNIANRGKGAKAKFYNGRIVVAGLLDDKKTKQKYMAAFYEDDTPAVGPDGKFIQFAAISSDESSSESTSSEAGN